MDASERRVLKRHNVRTPLRFRAVNLMGGVSDHFTQAINVSRTGSLSQSTIITGVSSPP